MTGFGTHSINLTINDTPVTITITIKSVNSRFFEATCKLPYALTFIEPDIIKLLKKKLLRGTIYCTVHFSSTAPLKAGVVPALSIIESYLRAADLVKKKFSVTGELTLANLFVLPNAFETPEEFLDKTTAEKILTATDMALKNVVAERTREGQALATDLNNRAKIIHQSLAILEPRAHLVAQERKKQALASIKELEHLSQEAKDHQLQTIYANLEKMAIHEEIVRFTTHLKNFETVLKNSEEEKGKKLEFILQELLREANTMAAKCADTIIATEVIAIKVELEKAREQVQNIV